MWQVKVAHDRYDEGSSADESSPKARMARTMQHFVDHFEETPVVVLPCLVRYRDPTPTEGASIYPACQNLLLAARALGYGGVMTTWHQIVEDELRPLLGIPDGVFIAATIPLGRPVGHHGPSAAARSPSWCTTTGGTGPPRGPSTPRAPGSRAPDHRRILTPVGQEPIRRGSGPDSTAPFLAGRSPPRPRPRTAYGAGGGGIALGATGVGSGEPSTSPSPPPWQHAVGEQLGAPTVDAKQHGPRGDHDQPL